MSSKTLKLFSTFFKIGAFTFGGGYAMIPMIQKEVVDTNSWLGESDIMDIIAIAETTPGPIAINAATFVGYKVAGKKGAFFSTLGVVLPSFLIITLIVLAFQKYMTNQVVENAFWGIRITVLALMAKAVWSMYKQCPKNALSYSVAVLAFIALSIFNINVLYIVLTAAILGIAYNSIRKVDKK